MLQAVFPIVLLLAQVPTTQPKERPEFTVTGYGKVFYQVDMADIQFSVSVRDKDVQTCKKKHDELVARVNEYLQERGYPKEILSLQATSLRRQSNHSKFDGDFYLAQSVFSLRTNRMETLSALQADLVQRGVDEIQHVTLLSSKQRELEDEARKLAILDAKKQAALTAEELGWKLGKPVKVTYANSYYGQQPQSFGSRGGDGGGGAGPMAASANYVGITVSVTFTYMTE